MTLGRGGTAYVETAHFIRYVLAFVFQVRHFRPVVSKLLQKKIFASYNARECWDRGTDHLD
jgi:hypothetical protein